MGMLVDARERLPVGSELPRGPSKNGNTSIHRIHYVHKIETNQLLRNLETVFSAGACIPAIT